HGEGVHDTGQRRALLTELDEDLTEAVIGVGSRVQIPFRARDGERDRLTGSFLRQPLPNRSVLHDRILLRGVLLVLAVLRRRRQRLTHLAVVTVDRQGFETELPALEVDLLDILDSGRFRHIDRLGDRAGQEGLYSTHHPHVAHRGDRTGTDGTVENIVVFRPEPRSVDDVP